ncbi:MAG TPA: hypothetical protein DEO84_07185 [candidate division Zixibacteria bacterium]|nr:hypothetical protein [candidate division Zixibacteria bacterium]
MSIRTALQRLREFYNTRWYASLIIIFSVLMLLMLMEVKNHRFRANDFKVYHRAAERLIQGENLYRPDIDGHYYYKYSPTAAVYFVPSALLPVSIAKVLHWIVMACMACLGFYLALIMVRPKFRIDNPRKINNLLLLLGLILGVHLEREFFLGQVNHILLVLYLIFILLANRKNDLPASLIWAGTIFIKPFGFIFLPYYLIKNKFKLVLYFCLFTTILIFAPLPFTGLANFASQYQHWFHELSVEMSWKQSLLASENDTIFSILARYSPLRLLDFTPGVTRIFQLIILALIGLLFLYLIYRGRHIKNSYVLETAFLTALIPILSFTNHYAFQFIELAAFLIIFNYRQLSKEWRIAAIVGLTLTAINMHDVWGGAIWQFLNEISLVAIGAIIVQAVLVEFRLKKVA